MTTPKSPVSAMDQEIGQQVYAARQALKLSVSHVSQASGIAQEDVEVSTPE